MLVGEHCQAVRADLVRRIAVGRDAVGADYDHPHLSAAHEPRGCRVDDQFGGDAGPHELPSGEPCALEPWTRLGAEHGRALARLPRCADHSQRCAEPGGGQRPGIAVRQHASRVRHEGGAVPADGAVRFDVLPLRGVRELQEAAPRLGGGGGRARGVEAALHGPTEVHRRGPGSGEARRDRVELVQETRHRWSVDLPGGQRHSVGGDDSQRRSSPHAHLADRLHGLVGVLNVDPLLSLGQPGLVQQRQVVVLPTYRVDVVFETHVSLCQSVKNSRAGFDRPHPRFPLGGVNDRVGAPPHSTLAAVRGAVGHERAPTAPSPPAARRYGGCPTRMWTAPPCRLALAYTFPLGARRSSPRRAC